MKIGSLILTTLTPCMVGCSIADNATDLAQVARSGDRFRYLAREMYQNISLESCEINFALRRSVVLKNEIEAVTAFEQTNQSGPKAGHLAIAKSDIAYQKATGTLGCWADSDPRFAASHVKMARENVVGSLNELKSFDSTTIKPLRPIDLNQPRAAEFRNLVRSLVAYLNPLCGGSIRDDAIFAPARAEMDRFRQRLKGSPYDVQFSIAEADERYELSQLVPSCDTSAPESPAELASKVLKKTREDIRSASTVIGR